MKKLHILIACVLAATLIACGGSKGKGTNTTGDKYELCYKFEVGETYNQAIKMDINIVQAIMGQEMDMSVTMDMGLSYTIVNVKDDIIEASMAYTSIKMGMTMPMGMGTFSFSSEEESTDNSMMPVDMHQILKAFKNMKIDVEMTKYGEVKSMSSLEAAMDEALNSISLSAHEAQQAKAMMSQGLSEEKVIEQMKNMAIYPNHPVAVGESWKINVDNETTDMENTYTLKKVTDNEVIIDVESVINRLSMSEEGVNGSLSGTQVGTNIVHRSSGWIKEAKLTQDVSGDVTAQGMKVKMKMKSDISISE